MYLYRYFLPLFLVAGIGVVPSWAKSPRAVHDPVKDQPKETAAPLSPIQASLRDLKSADVVLRRKAVEDLANLRDPAATPALIVALSDEDPSVRAGAARTLGLLRANEAVRELTRLLKEDPSSQVRQSAAVAAGHIGDASVMDPLIQALKDSEMSVRLSAVHSLSTLRQASAVPALLEALGDPSPQFRRSVINALSHIGDPSAMPALRPYVNDPDLQTQVAAVHALGLLKDQESAPVFKRFLKKKFSPELRVAAAYALFRQGSAAGRNVLLEVLKNVKLEKRPRLQAVYAIRELEDASFLPVLQEVEASEPEGDVKRILKDTIEKLSAQQGR